jgi:hypothetical protein
MRLHEVENPPLEVVMYADLHCMEDIGLVEVAHNNGNMSNRVEFLGNMVRQEFGIGRHRDWVSERCILVMILPGVVRSYIISKLVLWTLAPNTDMPLQMI